MISTLYLEGQTRYFTALDRCTIQQGKNKMDSKFIKSHRCSLERSHAVFRLKLILNSDQDLALSRQKQILTGLLTSDKNLQKQNNGDFFIQLLYACQATSHQ